MLSRNNPLTVSRANESAALEKVIEHKQKQIDEIKTIRADLAALPEGKRNSRRRRRQDAKARAELSALNKSMRNDQRQLNRARTHEKHEQAKAALAATQKDKQPPNPTYTEMTRSQRLVFLFCAGAFLLGAGAWAQRVVDLMQAQRPAVQEIARSSQSPQPK